MRTIPLLILLAMCFAVPYFLLEKGGVESILDRWYGRNQASTESDATESDGVAYAGTPIRPNSSTIALTDTTARVQPTSSTRPQLPVELAPVMNLEDVFNFNITPAWVLGRWPNVTTGLRKNELVGYRVPLVTGTDRNDITGALTYYFGQTQQLQQILFDGDTGDGRRLVGMATSQLGMQQYASTEPGVYVYRKLDNETVINELQLRPSGITNISSAGQRFRVALQLTRPEAPVAEKSYFWSSWIK